MAHVRTALFARGEITAPGQPIIATVPAGERWLVKNWIIVDGTAGPGHNTFMGVTWVGGPAGFRTLHYAQTKGGDIVEWQTGVVFEEGDQLRVQISLFTTGAYHYWVSGIRFHV